MNALFGYIFTRACFRAHRIYIYILHCRIFFGDCKVGGGAHKKWPQPPPPPQFKPPPISLLLTLRTFLLREKNAIFLPLYEWLVEGCTEGVGRRRVAKAENEERGAARYGF